ncbi:MAG: nucleotidyltransferase [Ignavibacteriales bacterium]|nr:MAG: nucleotidyltransferase [Ignavibacteriales bacterium]
MDKNLVILAGGISSRMKKSVVSESDIDKKLINDADEKSKSMIGVGNNYRPFLDYLLFNANKAGYKDVTIVIGEKDNSIKDYYGYKNSGNKFLDLEITYAVQFIPDGKEKPLGTADALYQAVKLRSDWKGKKFSVCNSDNLYSVEALDLMLKTEYKNAMPDYDRSALDFEVERIEKFAVTIKDDENFLLDIIEKPDADSIEKARDTNNVIGVSMNLFSLDYDMIYHFLETVPFNPVRNEKELPDAIKLMLKEYPKSLFCYPFAEHVPDLTNKSDIIKVKKYLEENFTNIL